MADLEVKNEGLAESCGHLAWGCLLYTGVLARDWVAGTAAMIHLMRGVKK